MVGVVSSTTLETKAAEFSAWAMRQSGSGALRHRAVRAFLAIADAAGYQFDPADYQINGYSVRHSYDQVAQFAESVRINECDTRLGR